VDGKGENDGGKLDPLETKQIHGSKPTKSHHTNKSKKKLGYFWLGFSNLGKNTQNHARNGGVENTEENTKNTQENTQEQVQSHIH
jgi:hypothetical protein